MVNSFSLLVLACAVVTTEARVNPATPLEDNIIGDNVSALAQEIWRAPAHASSLAFQFYCPKVFVPARPGGFRSDFGKQGCCIAGKAMALLDLVYALHRCKRFQAVDGNKPCFRGALDRLREDLKDCCVTKNALGADDFAEEDEECAASVGVVLAQLARVLGDAYDHCVSLCERGNCRAHHSPQCHAAVRAAIPAFEHVTATAYEFFSKEPTPDLTADSRNLVLLCAHLDPEDAVDTDRCLKRIKDVLKHSHGQIKYKW